MSINSSKKCYEKSIITIMNNDNNKNLNHIFIQVSANNRLNTYLKSNTFSL